MGFWTAFQFLTIIPLPFRREPESREMRASLSYFPLVGLLIGGILFGMDFGLNLILAPAVANALVITAWILITGALHLDGFMDTCDGLAGDTPQRRLEIMADTRVGAFGIIGVCALLLVKYGALVSLPNPLRMEALLLLPTLGRWTMVYALFAFPYARRTGGLGQAFKQQATWQRLTVATLITLGAIAGLMRWQGVVIMAIAWIIALAIGYFFRSRLGGLTGDTYGAISELVEVLVLVIFPLVANIGGNLQ